MPPPSTTTAVPKLAAELALHSTQSPREEEDGRVAKKATLKVLPELIARGVLPLLPHRLSLLLLLDAAWVQLCSGGSRAALAGTTSSAAALSTPDHTSSCSAEAKHSYKTYEAAQQHLE
jgi:hypothetical protein